MEMKSKLECIFKKNWNLFLNIILYGTIKYLEFSSITFYKKILRKIYSKHENIVKFWGLISFCPRAFSSTKKLI